MWRSRNSKTCCCRTPFCPSSLVTGVPRFADKISNDPNQEFAFARLVDEVAPNVRRNRVLRVRDFHVAVTR